MRKEHSLLVVQSPAVLLTAAIMLMVPERLSDPRGSFPSHHVLWFCDCMISLRCNQPHCVCISHPQQMKHHKKCVGHPKGAVVHVTPPQGPGAGMR